MISVLLLIVASVGLAAPAIAQDKIVRIFVEPVQTTGGFVDESSKQREDARKIIVAQLEKRWKKEIAVVTTKDAAA